MSKPNDIRIWWPPYNGANNILLTPYGRKYSDSIENIEREDRAASGKLRWDIIAQKKTFTLQYDVIDQAELEVFDSILRLYSTVELRLDLTFVDPHGGENRVESYMVKIRPYSRERILAIRGGLWRNVTITFVEV